MELITLEKSEKGYDLRSLINYFSIAKNGTYQITIKRVHWKRSNRQNAWLWGCIYPLLKYGMIDAGWDNITDEDDVHEFFKQLLSGKRIVNKQSGEIITIPNSTKQMDTLEFSTYCEKLREYGKEYLGIEIPEPTKEILSKS